MAEIVKFKDMQFYQIRVMGKDNGRIAEISLEFKESEYTGKTFNSQISQGMPSQTVVGQLRELADRIESELK